MSDSSVDVRSIFTRALEIGAADDRAAYLDEACGGDAAMRAEVDALLAAAAHAGNFMHGPPTSALPTSAMEPVAEGLGAVIGHYKLLQKIGEGGMGVVFMAEQSRPVQRTVALKIIKPGMDSRQVVARFEAERQALALMDHPNIARVLDAGSTDSGRPYFVMELVKGVAITQYCDEHQLTPRERLELFLPVCQAVQHAHQKGVIHRDIKPTNVLVTEYDQRAVPKVIDFGVAKATAQKLTERTLFTEFGAIVGTFEYMSPEQAKLNQLDIDTRTDVYSLGVLLYELLTGETPFDRQRLRSAAFDEVLRIIREEEPPKPSTRLSGSQSLTSIAANRHVEPQKLTKLVRGELDWVVMKALEKDRNRRYETAGALAHDIGHFLADEPVEAGPPSVAYRMRKLIPRHRQSIAGGAMIGLMLLATVGVVARNAVQRANDKATQRALMEQRINEELASAEGWYRRSKLAPAMEAIKRAEKLVESRDDELAQRVRQRMLDLQTAERLDRIRLESAVSKGDNIVGSWKHNEYWAAFEDYGLPMTAVSAAEGHRPREWAAMIRKSFIQKDLIAAIDDYAVINATDVVESANARSMLNAARMADPNPWRQSLYFLLIGQGDNIDRQTLVSDEAAAQPASTVVLTAHYLDAQDYKPYEYDGMHQAVALLRKAQQRHPDDLWINLHLANYLSDDDDPQRTEEAVGYARAAVALRPDSSLIRSALAWILRELGRHVEAAKEYQRAIELEPDSISHRWDLGHLYCEVKDWEKALATYEAAMPLSKDLRHGAGDSSLRMEYVRLLCDCPEPAFRNPQRAIELATPALKANPQSSTAWHALGWAYYRAGDREESIKALSMATTLNKKSLQTWQRLGEAQYAAGRWEASLESFGKVLELKTRDRFRDTSEIMRAELFMAMAHWRRGKKDEARKVYDKALVSKDQSHRDEELPAIRAQAETLLGIQPADESVRETKG